jgi:hypothetical protein
MQWQQRVERCAFSAHKDLLILHKSLSGLLALAPEKRWAIFQLQATRTHEGPVDAAIRSLKREISDNVRKTIFINNLF